jgi:propionyl-CoA synthetase
LYENDERYTKEYLTNFPGYYDTKDAGLIDSDGYVHVMSRTDDIINTSGMRLSTGAMEETLLEHPDITDCAVLGVKDDLKGEIPCGFVIVSPERDPSKEHELLDELVDMVRKKLGPVSNFKKVAIVKALPKTRSGKVLRGTMRKIANREEYTIAPTIEDLKVIDDLIPVILKLVDGK